MITPRAMRNNSVWLHDSEALFVLKRPLHADRPIELAEDVLQINRPIELVHPLINHYKSGIETLTRPHEHSGESFFAERKPRLNETP